MFAAPGHLPGVDTPELALHFVVEMQSPRRPFTRHVGVDGDGRGVGFRVGAGAFVVAGALVGVFESEMQHFTAAGYFSQPVAPCDEAKSEPPRHDDEHSPLLPLYWHGDGVQQRTAAGSFSQPMCARA